MHWTERRAEESRGFVGRRIVSAVLITQKIKYGQSFFVNYGKYARVLSIFDVYEQPS